MSGDIWGLAIGTMCSFLLVWHVIWRLTDKIDRLDKKLAEHLETDPDYERVGK